MKQALRFLGLAIGAIAAVAVGIDARAAGTYKWVDDQGVVHYSDKAPAEKGATVLDKQGRQIRKIEPPLSPEQQRAKEEEAEHQRVLGRVKEDQARRDKALMQSYTSEKEIDIARSRAISTIESQIKSAQAYHAELTRRQQDIATKKASYGKLLIPVELERESAAVDSELSRQMILLRQKQEELTAAETKYASIKQRWHEIVSDADRAAAAAAAEASAKAAGSGTGKSPTVAPAPASTAASK